MSDTECDETPFNRPDDSYEPANISPTSVETARYSIPWDTDSKGCTSSAYTSISTDDAGVICKHGCQENFYIVQGNILKRPDHDSESIAPGRLEPTYIFKKLKTSHTDLENSHECAVTSSKEQGYVESEKVIQKSVQDTELIEYEQSGFKSKEVETFYCSLQTYEIRFGRTQFPNDLLYEAIAPNGEIFNMLDDSEIHLSTKVYKVVRVDEDGVSIIDGINNPVDYNDSYTECLNHDTNPSASRQGDEFKGKEGVLFSNLDQAERLRGQGAWLKKATRIWLNEIASAVFWGNKMSTIFDGMEFEGWNSVCALHALSAEINGTFTAAYADLAAGIAGTNFERVKIDSKKELALRRGPVTITFTRRD